MNSAHPVFTLKQPLIRGTLLLTFSGLLVRAAGFFYKIFLSRTIGAGQLGLFSLVMPLFAFFGALCGGGVQTAVSRFAAEYRAKGDKSGERRVLGGALLLSVGLSVPCSLLLFFGAPWLSARILMEPACAPLLRLIAPSLPFGMVHSCLDGYFTGKKKTLPPALTQIAEQLLRICAAVAAAAAAKELGKNPDASVMAAGQLCGEIAAASLSLFFLRREKHAASPSGSNRACETPRGNSKASPYPGADLKGRRGGGRIAKTARKLSSFCIRPRGAVLQTLSVSAPLSLNRVLMCILQSSEAALLPQMLRQSGMTGADALSVCGTLTGMVLPLILFPSAVTGAFGMLLLPSVSEARILSRNDRIAKAANAGFCGGLALGSFFFGVFLLFGEPLGNLLFQSSLAGVCIRRLALLCPLLYIGMTLTGILHALGKTSSLLLWDIAAFALRLACVLFLVPSRGLNGYLTGLFAGHAFRTLCMLVSLRRQNALTLPAADAVLRLLSPALLSSGLTAALWYAVQNAGISAEIPALILFALCYSALFLLSLYLLLPPRLRPQKAA